MADAYTGHFGINNIPYGIASSSKRTQPQAVTRIGDEVIFLAELAQHSSFTPIEAHLHALFSQPTLNAFAAQSQEVHTAVRSAIQNAYRSNLHGSSAESVQAVTLHLPVSVGDFTDYSASANHVLNAGEAIMGTRSFPPGFHKYPIGYAGRCSSLQITPTPITRPWGQFVADPRAAEKNIIFAPTRALDYELELAAVIGRPVAPGTRLHARDAGAHVFGLVLLNDWSARDIQGLEMNPLGPFNGKNFATSVGAWVVTMDALRPFAVRAPERMGPVAGFMDDEGAENYDIALTGEVRRGGVRTRTCSVGFETMYWTFGHMVAHHVVGGCGLRTGDLVASGTVSGEGESEHGCLLELTKNGKVAARLEDGGELRYLEDGDEVTYEAVVGGASAGVGFGACVGVVQAAWQGDDLT